MDKYFKIKFSHEPSVGLRTETPVSGSGFNILYNTKKTAICWQTKKRGVPEHVYWKASRWAYSNIRHYFFYK